MLSIHNIQVDSFAVVRGTLDNEEEPIAVTAPQRESVAMTWKSPGMTHLWCPKCQRQYGTDAELVFKDGKILFKWKCKTCGSEILSEG